LFFFCLAHKGWERWWITKPTRAEPRRADSQPTLATLKAAMMNVLKENKEKWLGFFVAFMYGLVSISITFFNKAVLSVYDFHYSNTLTLGQMVFAIVALFLMKSTGVVSYKDFSFSTARAVLPLAFFFFGMVVTGLAALQFVNVPMFSALRRLATLLVIVGEAVFLKKMTPPDESWSVYLMVIGALVAGLGDMSFSLIGYLLCGLNCLVTAGYLVFIAKVKNETKLDTFGLMFYNNILSLPIVAIVVWSMELDGLLTYSQWSDPGFILCFVMSSVQAFALNYFIFLCSIINSPLTTSVTGQIKNIFTTVIGLFIFGDVQISFLLLVGLFVATAASMWYTHIKYLQQAKPKPVSIDALEVKSTEHNRQR